MTTTTLALRGRVQTTSYLAVLVKLAQAVYAVMKLFPVQNKVVMISRNTTKPSVDFLMLKEEIERTSSAKVVILPHKMKSKFQHGLQVFVEMWHLATSKTAIVDGYVIPVSILTHKKELKIIQIWHALGAIKKFGYQTIGKKAGNSEEMAEVMSMHKNYTYVTAPSKITAETYAKCFNVSKRKILKIGMPRVDYLLNEEIARKNREEMLEKFNLGQKKVILYVPTFRKKGRTHAEKLIEVVDLDKYDLMIKLHPLDKTEITESDGVTVIREEIDAARILPVADFVISDYSAIAMEAALLRKPLFFWDYDMKKYEKDCGLTLDYKKEMPGVVAKKPGKILEAIEEFEKSETLQKKYNKKLNKFLDKYIETRDGKCTRKIVRRLGL